MIRSISYSRYFRMATPRHTASTMKLAALKTAMTAWTAAGTCGSNTPVKIAGAPQAMARAHPLASHFSC